MFEDIIPRFQSVLSVSLYHLHHEVRLLSHVKNKYNRSSYLFEAHKTRLRMHAQINESINIRMHDACYGTRVHVPYYQNWFESLHVINATIYHTPLVLLVIVGY